MRPNWLALCVTLLAGLLATPLPAQAGPTTCPANSLCIDESVEGATPTITTPANMTATISAVSVPVGEEWAISISTPRPTTGFINIAADNVGLQEPGSGLLSDALIAQSLSVGATLITLSTFLFSDNELGQIGTTCPSCSFLTEDGTFQQLPNNFFQTSLIGTVNVFLKSDLDVPEPTSLALLGTALVGFGVMRRRRRRAS